MRIPFTNFHVYSASNERNVADRQVRAAAQQPIVMTTPPAPRRNLGFAFGPKLLPHPFDMNRLANAGVMNRVGEILANDGANRSLANLQEACSGMQAHVFETLHRQQVQAGPNSRSPAEARNALANIRICLLEISCVRLPS